MEPLETKHASGNLKMVSSHVELRVPLVYPQVSVDGPAHEERQPRPDALPATVEVVLGHVRQGRRLDPR